MNFSQQYADLQRQFHIERPDYGISGVRYSDQIQELSLRMQTRDILDYGCGKATLQKNLPFPIQNYDPFVPEYSAQPHPADIVVCTDVMEHVEQDYVVSVLTHIQSLTKKLAFFQIATRAASKFLPDGRNAHLIQEPVNWWLTKMMPFFDVLQVNDMKGGFVFIGTPHSWDESK